MASGVDSFSTSLEAQRTAAHLALSALASDTSSTSRYFEEISQDMTLCSQSFLPPVRYDGTGAGAPSCTLPSFPS